MNWRNDPSLKGKLHPEHPDDLQVVIHDGGPRLSSRSPEAVWVSITASDNGVFSGRVLNAPTQLESVEQNQAIRFIVDAGTSHPVMVTEKYLRERAAWRISPCANCGFANLFDAPSDLIRATFPNVPADATMEAFTAFCPLCGGAQAIESLEASVEDKPRPWWRFWR